MRLFIVSGRGVVVEAPPLTIKPALVVDDAVVTAVLPLEVQLAIREAQEVAMQAVRVALAPYGLSPWDIQAPTFRRVVSRDEIRERTSR